MSNYILEI